MSEIKIVGVIGSGAWGTALAEVCARAGLAVILWTRETQVAEDVRRSRENHVFLPGVRLSEAIEVTEALEGLAVADMVLAAAPAQHLRATLTAFSPFSTPGLPVVLCSKGVEQGSLKLMSQVLHDCIPQATPAVLSGPSFAGEVARGLPTAVTLACGDTLCSERVARALATRAFRPYRSTDLIGAEVGGAVKNVLAIACGVIEGRGLGRSAHAALITRGFAELTRFAVALGGQAETVQGLCGLGDLVLTCSSSQSRNMSVGLALGRGESLSSALADKQSVAEGVFSAPAVRELSVRLGVETPICHAVAAVLLGEIDIDTAIDGLLSRPLQAETGPRVGR